VGAIAAYKPPVPVGNHRSELETREAVGAADNQCFVACWERNVHTRIALHSECRRRNVQQHVRPKRRSVNVVKAVPTFRQLAD
jgi:hypothetical protein